MMIKNKTFINFIMVTLMVSFLTILVGKVSPVYGMAALPLADPVYDTEIIALYDYVTQNIDAPQLDIFFFISGALAVAQLGAQDAKLISPYDSEENIKQWLINCGIQLYNSVIGLVPSGDYYIGVDYPTRGIKRDELKMLVATLMGNAVLARNYNNLDDFLDENPDNIYISLTPELQLGVNAVFGLNGGFYDWQFSDRGFNTFEYYTTSISNADLAYMQTLLNEFSYRSPVNYYASPTIRNRYNSVVDYDFNSLIGTYHNFFFNMNTGYLYLYDDNGSGFSTLNLHTVYYFNGVNNSYITITDGYPVGGSYTPTGLFNDLISYRVTPLLGESLYTLFLPFNTYNADYKFWYGTSWNSRIEFNMQDDLNLLNNDMPYFQQVANDYLLDIRGLISDLVGVTDIFNEIKNNLFDLTGIIELNPKFIDVSIDLPDLSLLVDPPIPVNLNDIAELTDNTYLERVKEHAKNFGDIFVQYFAFWHNVDADIVYTMFGATILVLVGAFIGKWGHS